MSTVKRSGGGQTLKSRITIPVFLVVIETVEEINLKIACNHVHRNRQPCQKAVIANICKCFTYTHHKEYTD
jgi:hypothetical protein